MDLSFLESVGKFAAAGGSAALVFKLFARDFESRLAQEDRLLAHVTSLNDKLSERLMYGNGRGPGGLAQIEEKVTSIAATLEAHGELFKKLPCLKKEDCPDDPA